MAGPEQVFDELFRRTLDCITELRNRELDASLALQAANSRIARYESLLTETPDGLGRRNGELCAEIEEARKETAELRARLSEVTASHDMMVRQLAEALEAARGIQRSRL